MIIPSHWEVSSAEVTRIGPGQRCEKLPSSRPVANSPPGTVRVGARPARRQSQRLGRGDGARRCGLAWARRCGGQREGVESGRVQDEGRQALLPGWMRGARRRGRSSGFGVKNWGVGVSVLQGGKTR